MRVWVAGVYSASSSQQMMVALAAQGLEGRILSLSECRLDLARGTVLWNGIDLSDLDGIVVRKLGDPIDPLAHYRVNLLHQLSFCGVRIFSPPSAIEVADNRYTNTLRLQQAGVPIPKTVVTESIEEAEKLVEDWGKAVLKPLFSSKGRGMLLLDREQPFRLALKDWPFLRQYPFYLQEYIPARADMGLAFLGGEYLGAFRRVAQASSWQTTIRSGGHYEAATPAADTIALARKAADAFGLDYTVVDVVSDGQRNMVYEVSPFGGFSGLAASNIDPANLLASYVRKQLEGRTGR